MDRFAKPHTHKLTYTSIRHLGGCERDNITIAMMTHHSATQVGHMKTCTCPLAWSLPFQGTQEAPSAQARECCSFTGKVAAGRGDSEQHSRCPATLHSFRDACNVPITAGLRSQGGRQLTCPSDAAPTPNNPLSLHVIPS